MKRIFNKNTFYRPMKKLSILILFLLSFGAVKVQASHVIGGTITYDCLSANVFQVNLAAYRDCAGASVVPATSLQVTGVGPGCTAPTALTAWTLVSTLEYTPLGPGVGTICNGGSTTVNGVEERTFTRQYDFTGVSCTEYNLSWGTCCRNGAISSGQGNQSLGISGGTIRPGQASCNNSPRWRNFPVYMIPQNVSSTYDAGAYDPDGDSLVHSLAACTTDAFAQVTYGAGYSPTQPLGASWNVALNPANGLITFTNIPGNIVVAVICVKVEEYRNGILIGEITRDFMVYTAPNGCTPSAPPAFTGLTNLNNAFYHNGTATTDTIYVQPGSAFCFDITTLDPDLGAPQNLTWDRSIPGATFSDPANTMFDQVIDEDPTARFCWTAPATTGYVDVLLLLRDSVCLGDIPVLHNITIIVGDTGSVWPGDANDDLIANNLDLLSLGLAFGSSGPARTTTSNAWVAHIATPWLDTIPGGIDKKYQDCNGDGTVNLDDTLAITLNYGLTHTKARMASARGAATDPPLRLIIPEDSANVGDTITATITLGDSSITAADVYGIAFSLNYDATLIDSTTFRIEFNPSWLGNSSNSMNIDHNDFSQAACDGAQVRTDHQNVSGMGQIATAHFIIIDNIDGKQQLLTTEMLNFFFSDIVLISETGDRLAVDPQADSILVYELSTEFDAGLASGQEIKMYPNPANDNLTLLSEGSPINEFEVWNLQGQLVYRESDLNREKIRISTNHLQAGVYFVKIRNELGLQTRKLHITR